MKVQPTPTPITLTRQQLEKHMLDCIEAYRQKLAAEHLSHAGASYAAVTETLHHIAALQVLEPPIEPDKSKKSTR